MIVPLGCTFNAKLSAKLPMDPRTNLVMTDPVLLYVINTLVVVSDIFDLFAARYALAQVQGGG